MSKKETPHLDKWLSTFKNIGSGAGRVATSTLGNIAPGVSESVTSTADVLRESRVFVTKARNQIHYQAKALNRNITGRNANNVLADAFNDIKGGTYDIDKLADSSFESLEGFDDTISSIDSEVTAAGTDPAATALAESKRNTAILGKAVTEGNVATITGMQHMTKTLANVNIKVADANTAKITNVALMGINQVNAGFAGINNRLDAINKNLISMIEFNRTNVAVINEQTQQYQSDTTQMMHEMGKTLAEMQDFMQHQKEIVKSNKRKDDPFDFSNGFNARTYMDMVKHNYNNSMLGMLTSMIGMGTSMMGMGGKEGMVDFVGSTLLEALLPKSFKKTVGRFDKAFTQSMNNLVYSIGDLRNSPDFVKQVIGQLFGKERETFKEPKMDKFKRGSMSWNGIAQQTLVEVIPSYLARIESALTNNEARFYNMDKGKFQTESKITEDFQKSFTNSIEFGMSEFADKLNSTLSSSGIQGKDAKKIQSMINDAVFEALVKDPSKGGKTRKETMKSIHDSLSGRVDERAIHDLIMEATSGLDQTMKNLNDTVNNLNSASRHLFNEDGKSTSHLYKQADIFSGRSFTASGKAFEDLSESERRAEEAMKKMKSESGRDKFFNDFMTNLYGKDYEKKSSYKKHFEKWNPKVRREKREEKEKNSRQRYEKFDNMTDRMYDFVNGYDFQNVIYAEPTKDFQAPAVIRPGSNPSQKAATSRASSNLQRGTVHDRVRSNVNQSVKGMKDRDFAHTMNSSDAKRAAQSAATSNLVHTMKSAGNAAGPGSDTSESAEIALLNRIDEDETSLKTMVVSLNDNFLAPMVGGLFGKDGFFKKILSKENLTKIREKLFDEKDGIFKDATIWFKDQMDYIKYVFTGVGYTNRKGEKFDENKNSVLDHLANGYDFIYKNTMKYLFGDEYQDNETFNKYFQWMDFKGKRDKKREERIKRREEEEKKAQSNVNGNQNLNVINGPAGFSTADLNAYLMNKLGRGLPGSNSRMREEDIIDVDFKDVTDNRYISSKANRQLALPGPTPESNSAGFEIIPAGDIEVVQDTMKNNLIVASEQASTNIVEASTELSTALIGDYNDDTEKKIQSSQKKTTDSFFSKFKKWIPQGIASGIAGAAVGTSLGIHGTGLIGSLFLPGGPVGGAVLGVAANLLMKSKSFSKFMFGEEKDGKKVGGIISNKTQEFVKNNLPLIVGASALGAVKGALKSAAGLSVAGGPTGFLLNTLLPGGPIGGAVLGLGVALLKNNERFNKILFGEKNDDGKRDGGILSKGMSTLGKAFSKSKNFLKGGLKGAAIGVGSGIALGKMGLFGSALTATGPIGMGIMGLGIGIASQADRVKEMLFGTEEFDEEGNSKGRRKDGLIHKVRNMIVMNILDPIKTQLQNKVEDFAFWAKKNLTYPFREAFGPILDSMKGIKKDISDAVHETFNNIAEKVGNALKTGIEKVFSPLTKVMGGIGSLMTSTVSTALKLSLAPVTGGLKLMSFATRNMRKKAKGEETKTIFEHLGTIGSGIAQVTRDQWANDDRDYGKGVGGKINRFLTHGRDIFQNTKQGFDAAHAAYRAEMGEQGFNSLGWMNIEDEKKQDKKNREKLLKDREAWKKIDKIRNKIAHENKSGEVFYSSEKLKEVQDELEKAGLDPRYVRNNEDLNNLLYNKTDFMDNLKKDKKDKEAVIKDSPATQDFYSTTKSYQEFVMNRFDFITKEFTKYAAQKALEKKQNLDISDLEEMDDRFKKAKISWDDIGIDPSKLVNIDSVSEADWDKYMEEKFGSGEVKDDPTGFSKLIKSILDREEKTEETNEAIIEELDELNKTSEANMRMNMSEQAIDTGASENEVEKAAGFNADTKTFKLSSIVKRNKENAEREAEEAKESEAARTGHKSFQDEESEDGENNEAIIDGVSKDSKTKSTVFGSIGSFFSKIFGTLGGLLVSPTFWKIAGGTALVAALFGDKLKSLVGKILDFISPVTDYLKVKIPELVKTAGDWISTNGPAIVSTMVDNVCDNMGFIIDNVGKLLYSAISTLGKKLADKIGDIFPWLGEKLGWGTDASSEYTDYGTDEEAATTAAEESGKNVYYDQTDGSYKILGSSQIVDENGEIQHVEDGASSFKGALARESVQLVRSKTNRTLAKNTVKGAAKIAGWVSGITPIGKLVKGAAKLTIGAGKGVVKGTKSVVSAVKNRAAKKAGEAVIETTAKEGVESVAKTAAKEGTEAVVESVAKNATKDTTEAVIKKGAKEVAENVAEEGTEVLAKKKVIKTFLTNASKTIKGAAVKVKNYIGETAFGKAIDSMIKTISDKIMSSDNKIIKKVAEKITAKSAEATGKTVADATVIVGIGFAIYDGINGALSAAYLFGVSDDDVTAGMRAVSSIMEILLGTAFGAWIDILLEVWNLLTGNNAKQWFARLLYKALGGDSAKLDDAIAELEAETQKYNQMNGTNITSSEYNEMKNGSLTIGSRVKNFFTGKKTADYTQYAVTDEELENYKNTKNISTSSSVSKTNTATITYSSDSTTTDLLYGPGPKGAIGYGKSLSQSDPRWANYPIGKFPDGSTSTMATGGCGPTALSMVAEGFGSSVDPLGVATYAKQNGYIKDGGATSDLFTKGASGMGLSSTDVSKSTLRSKLASGNSVIISGKSGANGPYTEAGHVIVASGLDSNGKAIVNDPMRGQTTIDTSELENGMTHGWTYSKSVGYGSPAISLKIKYFEYNGKNYSISSKGGVTTYTEMNGTEDLSCYEKIDTPSYFNDTMAAKANKSSIDYTTLNAALQTAKANSNAASKNLPTAGVTNVLLDTTSTGTAIDYSNLPTTRQATSSKIFSTSSNTKSTATDLFIADNLLNGYRGSTTVGSYNNSLVTDKKAYLFEDGGPVADVAYATIQNSIKYGILKTQNAVENKIKSGYSKSNGDYKFNTDVFYLGLKVADLVTLATYQPSLLTDSTIPNFKILYNYFVKSEKFSLNSALNATKVKAILGKSEFIEALGGNGSYGDWEYKYGFPFFQTDDSRWANIPWRGESVKTRGGDLASLAMVASAFGSNIISPDYINDNWLADYPQWWSSTNGLDMDKVFTDGGFNAMKASQVDGKRLTTSKITNVSSPNTILSALKLKKPVVLTGYRYKGSMFGGNYDVKTAPTSNPDDYATIVARAADDAHLAVLNPFTTLNQNGVFDTTLLQDKVGSSNTPVVKSAYIISGPNGEGIDTPVDLSKKDGGTSDYTDLSSVSGLEKITALFKNIAAVGSHLLSSLIDGEAYKSIYTVNEIEGDGEDDTGVGKAIITETSTDENGNTTETESVVDQSAQIESTNTVINNTKAFKKQQYFKKGKLYYLRYKENGKYVYKSFTAKEWKVYKKKADNSSDIKLTKIDTPKNFNANMATKYTKSSTSTTASTTAGAATVLAPTVATPSVNGGSAITINPTTTAVGGSAIQSPSRGGGGHSIGGGFRDFVFGPATTDDSTSTDSDTTTTDTSSAVISLEDSNLSTSQKLSAIANASMASMMGEDYETAKQQYLASAAGSSTTSDDTTTGTTSGTIYDVVDASDASLADMKKPDAIQMADLKTIPHVSANQIKAALQKYFINKGGTFKAENLDNDSYGLYDAQENSGLSAIVPMGISALESGWGGTSKIAKEKGNLWGWGASNSNPSKNAKTFDPNDMGLSFKNYSIALLNKYYDEYGAHSINAIGTGNNKAGLGYAYTDDGKISTTWAPSVQSTSKRIVEAMPEGSETKVGSSTQTVKGPGSARIVYGTAALRRFKSRSIGYGGDWLNIVSRVKAAIGNQKLGYSQSKKITVTLDGVSRTNRRDCSGFVSLCVSFYTGSEFNGTSSTFNSSINSTLSNAGFAHLSWPGWDGLVAGDIIARNNGSNGHVEIYAGKENGRHKVYNCGGNDSCNTPGTTNAGSSPFTSVWRPNSAGTAITNVASTGDSATGTDADGTSTTSTTVLTPFAKLIATIKSAGESMMTVNGKQIAFGPGSNSGNNPAAWFTNTLGGSITSGYGARSTSLGNEYHKGLDISAQNGQDIYSPIDGEVVSTGTDVAGYGNYAVVRDSEGNNHIFAHMNKPVGYGVGSKISKNDVIGQVGSSGNATGDHLHYEIRRNGNKYSAINPMNYKYDNSVGKSLNVNTVHSSQRGTELEAVGSGKRDLSTEAKEKLDVAINTTNIEDKMDTMIEALKIMVDNSSKVTPATSNTVNNTTTTVAYGTGKSNTKTSTKKSSSKQYDDSMSLAEIHKAIATRS